MGIYNRLIKGGIKHPLKISQRSSTLRSIKKELATFKAGIWNLKGLWCEGTSSQPTNCWKNHQTNILTKALGMISFLICQIKKSKKANTCHLGNSNLLTIKGTCNMGKESPFCSVANLWLQQLGRRSLRKLKKIEKRCFNCRKKL